MFSDSFQELTFIRNGLLDDLIKIHNHHCLISVLSSREIVRYPTQNPFLYGWNDKNLIVGRHYYKNRRYGLSSQNNANREYPESYYLDLPEPGLTLWIRFAIYLLETPVHRIT